MPQVDGSQLVNLLLPIGILVIFVLLVIVPQRRRDKKVRTMLEAVKAGDRIKTIGGIYGRVISIKEDLVIVETGPEKCKMEFAKGAISTVESATVENESKELSN